LTSNDIALGDEENWRLIAASLCCVALPVVAGIVNLGKHLDIEAMGEATDDPSRYLDGRKHFKDA